MMHISDTKSLCPKCLSILDAEIFEEKDKVWIRKKCKKHGKFQDLYYGDYEMYMKNKKWAHDGKGTKNPNTKVRGPCPKSCGLCKRHRSHTALGNIVVTNRCDLACFYCFFYAKAMGYVYEPTLAQIRMMLRKMRQEKPVKCNAVQLTGGEPTIRKDLVDIIKIAKEEGYSHVQLNTNGINLSKDLKLAKKIREAGVNTLYLSYDGTTPKTNPKNHKEIPKVLENCRKAGLGIVLVPTIIKTVNDHNVGNILKFGLKNLDVIRGINFQPVSLVGRITKADVRKYRITIPDVIKKMEETGLVSRDDFYPVPSLSAITHLVEALKGTAEYELTSHFACGMATYLFLDGKKVVPITRFVNVDGLIEYFNERADEIREGKNKMITSLKILKDVSRFVDKEKQPKNTKLTKILRNIVTKKGDYKSLGNLHHKSLFIGMMHFMDLWNYDIERVKRCCIHYAQPDGTVIPFCSFNVIPQWYRDKIQRKYALSIKKWEKKTGRKLRDDFYIRKKAK